jgi:proline racemase
MRWLMSKQVGLDIAPENARALAEAGITLKALISKQVSVSHIRTSPHLMTWPM